MCEINVSRTKTESVITRLRYAGVLFESVGEMLAMKRTGINIGVVYTPASEQPGPS